MQLMDELTMELISITSLYIIYAILYQSGPVVTHSLNVIM